MATSRDGRWRWANAPVPEAHVAGLLVGLILHAVRPRRLFEDRAHGRTAGWMCIAVGLAGIWWAVRAVGDQHVDRPAALVTTGPYAFSRNPMYVAWTALYAGIALVANAAWPLVLSPGVLAATHRTVRREERSLEQAFGDEYGTYRRSVPRYL